ncbi:glycoside hydrolase family 20 zincin-like fold domain-containing protein [Chitinophaga sp. MM2321]|uniref:glycoside hydrolase family 20 zincin-like fold domain-containing protein n=1 Tax=Chitinophaga sp. MM2321 TaxID=3137178 RepID=UPI0032D594BE
MKSLYFFICCLICIPGTHSAFAQDSSTDSFHQSFRLLPQPQQITVFKEPGIAQGVLHAIYLEKGVRLPVLYSSLKTLTTVANPGKGVVTLRIAKLRQLPDAGEGYVLEVRSGQVTITAETQAGLFYGCQTLGQLVEDARDQRIDIPSCLITDYPDIAYRAVHWDLKYHIDSLSYYYQMIDRLAHIKVNALIIEFEDKLKYEKAPLIGASNAMSIQTIAALSEYAHERHIEISPLVQGLGHVPFILKHEQYKSLRDDSTSNWAFCALNPGTYDLQFALYEDAIKATPYGKYLHVGGDEVGEIGKSALAKKSGMKPFELQMYWLKKVTDFAKQHHRIPIFWDDMIFKLSGLYRTTYDPSLSVDASRQLWQENRHQLDENLALFPGNCVFMRWNYGSQDLWGNLEALNWYKSKKLDAMAATAAQTNWMLMPRDHSNWEAIRGFNKITKEKGLDGILCTTWDDGSPHMETFMRGMYFFALSSWNTQVPDVAVVNTIFRHRFYGPAVSDARYEFQDQLENALSFWENMLVDEGDRNKSRRPFELIRLPDRNIPGEWRKKYRDKLTLAHIADEYYRTVQQKIAEVQAKAIRNQYHLSLLQQINEVQHYPIQLMFLLEAFDRQPVMDKTASVRDINAYVTRFNRIRKNFEHVFAQTRVLHNPDDYIIDASVSHANPANSMTTDWMYRFELGMNEKIRSWLTNFDY